VITDVRWSLKRKKKSHVWKN